MLRTYTSNALVLKRIDLGEKDKIVTLYTRELGKVSAVANGARKPGSKLSGSCEPFTYFRGLLNTGKELDVLTQSEIRESFPNIRTNIVALAHGFYIMELVNQLTDDRHPNPDLFDTILSALYILESGCEPEITARYFEISLLECLGYMPQFERCVRCGTKIGRERVAFSPALGGVACKRCENAPTDAIWVPAALGSYINALLCAAPQRLRELHFPRAAMNDLCIILKWHIRYRLERDLKSTEFLEIVFPGA